VRRPYSAATGGNAKQARVLFGFEAEDWLFLITGVLLVTAIAAFVF
jgi:hypothetical protein